MDSRASRDLPRVRKLLDAAAFETWEALYLSDIIPHYRARGLRRSLAVHVLVLMLDHRDPRKFRARRRAIKDLAACLKAA